MLDTIAGNEPLRAALKSALQSGRLPHSILLCGARGAGAGYAARCLAADYLYPGGGDGARCVMQLSSPELIVLEGEGASGEIRVERVREARKSLFATALSAEGRVVLIRGAHRLNASGANALLKVLEEPPEGVLFLLTAPGAASVLATVRSRSCAYTLAPVSAAECAARLRAEGASEAQAAELAAAFGGKIGLGLSVLRDENFAKRYAAARAAAAACEKRDAYAALLALAPFERDRAACLDVCDCLAELCAAALRGDEAAAGLSAQRGARALAHVRDARRRIRANAAAKLALTVLGMRLGEE